MVSRFSENDFGNDGASSLDGAWPHREETQTESTEKKVSGLQEETKCNLAKIPSCDFLIPVVIAGGLLWGVPKVIDLSSKANTKYALTSACELDPSLGTTHEYKTKRPDGTEFPHAIVNTSKKSLPHVVFGDFRKPIYVFQDSNGNEIVDGKEELQTFATPEEARGFLTKEVKRINSEYK